MSTQQASQQHLLTPPPQALCMTSALQDCTSHTSERSAYIGCTCLRMTLRLPQQRCAFRTDSIVSACCVYFQVIANGCRCKIKVRSVHHCVKCYLQQAPVIPMGHQ